MADSYELLADPIRRALWDMRWETLRPIQQQAIEVILRSKQDVIISARTASGKTEAAFLPILSQICQEPAGSIRALYVGPLKALINDQFRRLEDLCVHSQIPVHRWHGDVSASQRQRLLKQPGGVLLTTPESLEANFTRRSSALRHLFHGLKFVVIDELHALEGNERGTHLRSLLFRLDRYCDRPPRMAALSATLGDPHRSALWIRPDDPAKVSILNDDGNQKSIRYGIFTFLKPFSGNQSASSDESPPLEMSQDLYHSFSREKNLIFANSKMDVEWYVDELNTTAATDGRPGQFLIHHGALGKEIREHTERLMQGAMPYTTVCTSTLELGIDIGNVAVVGQIGCPWSVASLVQRLGRSGRRDEQPQMMRVYLLQEELPTDADLCSRLYPEVVRSVALTELMLEKWSEPPPRTAGDLSTLVQQILSVISETGGVKTEDLFNRLICQGGFRQVPQNIFIAVLRSMAKHDLVEQSPSRDLILGLKGEQIVNHYDFYAAFASAPEFQVIHQGQLLGMLPTSSLPRVGEHLLLAGRRWQVMEVDLDRREIGVRPGYGRKPPLFEGGQGIIADKVIQKMRDVLLGRKHFMYLNETGQMILERARTTAADCGLARSPFVELSASSTLWFPWIGTTALMTLGLILENAGISCSVHSVALKVESSLADLTSEFPEILTEFPEAMMLALLCQAKQRRKYDWCLSDECLNWSLVHDVIEIDTAKAAMLAAVRRN